MQDFSDDNDLLKEENTENKLTKEDILSKSRKENKKGDEREKQVYKTGVFIAAIIMMLCVCILFVTDFAVTRKFNFGYAVILMIPTFVAHIYEAKKLKKKQRIVWVILGAIYSVFFITLYVLTLCGII